MPLPIKDITTMFRAMNANWISRLFTLAILVIGLYGWLRVTKAKHIKDEVCEKQRSELLQALLDIKRDLQPTSQVSFQDYSFAVYDSIPKRNNQQQQVQRAINKIDSILLKYRIRQDTISNLKTKT